MTVPLRLDIWSDIMCPWCYVGWGNLRQALDALDAEIQASVHWRAFELNPQMPAEGEERTAHIARKYGRTIEQAEGVQQQMREAARAAGVSLDYVGPETEAAVVPDAMMWNTARAHSLLAWAYSEHGPARQTDLKLALFRTHFNARRRIGEDAVLLDIAAEQGFDRSDANRALDDPRWLAVVRQEEEQAMAYNITGVPAVVVEGSFLIPGAQGAETFENALRRVAAKRVSKR